jgi:CHASE1-domain containing sensor protein
VPVISILLTLAAWYTTRVSTTARAVDRFQLRTGAIESSIRQRLSNHEGLLRGVVGLFDARPSVTHEAWLDYVDAVRPERATPGLYRLGFSVRVPASERRRLEELARADGLSFTVWPDGGREEYHAVLFIHPFEPPMPAQGYDMFTEPTRREAKTRARDLGAPSLSGHVRLLPFGRRPRAFRSGRHCSPACSSSPS